MSGVFVIVPAAIVVNCTFAALGTMAARHYRISMTLLRGPALAVFATASVLECVALTIRPEMPSRDVLLAAFGVTIAGAACDAACGYVFDAITLPGLASMLLIALASHDAAQFLAGAAAAGGSLALLYAITRGKGLGAGDVKLACCIGGAAGAPRALEALAVAFVLGGAYAAYLLLTKRAHRKDELRFAPYLAAGLAAVVLRGAVS